MYLPPRLPVWTFLLPSWDLALVERVDVLRLPLPNIVSVDFDTTPMPTIVGKVLVISVVAGISIYLPFSSCMGLPVAPCHHPVLILYPCHRSVSFYRAFYKPSFTSLSSLLLTGLGLPCPRYPRFHFHLGLVESPPALETDVSLFGARARWNLAF